MGQRKLTDFEKYWIARAASAINSLVLGCRCPHHWDKRFADLIAVAEHGTTDGNPYIEPQPEIGEGYRVATEADKDRLDLEWVGGFRKWKVRGNRLRGYPLHSNLTYRVPVDRIPTDEDAKQRPTVMVRDRDNEKWNRATLYGVSPAKNYPFLCERSEVSLAMRQCRFQYPGELP